MLRILIILSFYCCCSIKATSQSFNLNYEIGSIQNSFHGTITKDDGMVISGMGHLSNFVIKTDCQGQIEWARKITSPYGLIFKNIVQTSDNGYAVVIQGTSKVIVYRLDSNGNFMWSKKYFYISSDSGWDLIASDFGKVIVVGGGCAGENFLFELNDQGEIITQIQYNTPSCAATGIKIIKSRLDGYIILNTYNPISSPMDIGITRIDDNFQLKWIKQYGSEKEDWASDIDEDSDGNIIITGSTKAFIDSTSNIQIGDMFISKFDSSGVELWTNILKISQNDYSNSLTVLSNGSYLIGGKTGHNAPFPYANKFLGNFSPNDGSLIWAKMGRPPTSTYSNGGEITHLISSDNYAYAIGYQPTGNFGATLLGFPIDGSLSCNEEIITPNIITTNFTETNRTSSTYKLNLAFSADTITTTTNIYSAVKSIFLWGFPFYMFSYFN